MAKILCFRGILDYVVYICFLLPQSAIGGGGVPDYNIPC